VISGDSILELKFASFLDSCPDVISFGKNYFAVNFKLDYLNADGNISYYYPDFLVKVKPKSSKEECYVVETKGREDLDDPIKLKRLKQWCVDVNAIPGAKQIWSFLYVTEEEFQKYRDGLKTFEDLVKNFREYQ
jgi:type III restriction enzyme